MAHRHFRGRFFRQRLFRTNIDIFCFLANKKRDFRPGNASPEKSDPEMSMRHIIRFLALFFTITRHQGRSHEPISRGSMSGSMWIFSRPSPNPKNHKGRVCGLFFGKLIGLTFNPWPRPGTVRFPCFTRNLLIVYTLSKHLCIYNFMRNPLSKPPPIHLFEIFRVGTLL